MTTVAMTMINNNGKNNDGDNDDITNDDRMIITLLTMAIMKQ